MLLSDSISNQVNVLFLEWSVGRLGPGGKQQS